MTRNELDTDSDYITESLSNIRDTTNGIRHSTEPEIINHRIVGWNHTVKFYEQKADGQTEPSCADPITKPKPKPIIAETNVGPGEGFLCFHGMKHNHKNLEEAQSCIENHLKPKNGEPMEVVTRRQGILYYPHGGEMILDDNKKTMTNRAYAEWFIKELTAGNSPVLPSERDEHGNKLWEYVELSR